MVWLDIGSMREKIYEIKNIKLRVTIWELNVGNVKWNITIDISINKYDT